MTASFSCPFCGATTRHPVDVAERYCAACSVFVDDVGTAADLVTSGDLPAEAFQGLTAGLPYTVDEVQRALRRERS